MPRVHYRKARKDYPEAGIKKGDMYYYTKLKLQRGGIVKRSLKPFRQSQLTTSPYKGSYYAMQEAWEDSEVKSGEAISAAAETLREIAEEATNSYEAMPEGLQEGETGQLLYERAEQCENKADELEGLASEYDDLEEPTEPDPSNYMEEATTADEAEDGSEAYRDAMSEYDDALAEYESEQERIIDEAGALIEGMPE